MIVIKREMYMKRIRPFIGTELIKVMTGIRRFGKSVMLEPVSYTHLDVYKRQVRNESVLQRTTFLRMRG